MRKRVGRMREPVVNVREAGLCGPQFLSVREAPNAWLRLYACGHDLPAELSAGSGDIVSLFPSESGGDTAFVEDCHECILPIFAGALPIESFHSVIRDAVYLGADAPGYLHERSRILRTIVDVLDQDILESDSLLFATGIVLAGLQ